MLENINLFALSSEKFLNPEPSLKETFEEIKKQKNSLKERQKSRELEFVRDMEDIIKGYAGLVLEKTRTGGMKNEGYVLLHQGLELVSVSFEDDGTYFLGRAVSENNSVGECVDYKHYSRVIKTVAEELNKIIKG